MINKIIHSVEFKSLLLQLRTVYNRTPGSKPSIPVEIRLFIAHRVKYVLTGRIKCIFFQSTMFCFRGFWNHLGLKISDIVLLIGNAYDFKVNQQRTANLKLVAVGEMPFLRHFPCFFWLTISFPWKWFFEFKKISIPRYGLNLNRCSWLKCNISRTPSCWSCKCRF